MKSNPMDLRLAMGAIFIILAVVMVIVMYNQANPEDGFVDAGGCGPDQRYVGGNGDFAICDRPGIRCINGYSKSDVAEELPYETTLPIRPKQFTNSPDQ